MQRPTFASRAEYGARFTDVTFWRPYVAEICRRHGIAPHECVVGGTPGTHPVFLVEGRWAVKLFSDLFGGERAWAAERDCYALTASAPQIDAPRQIAEGALFADGPWRWPYLVSSIIPGAALSAVWDEVTHANRAALAEYAGRQLRALHALPLEGASALGDGWDTFAETMAERHAACTARHWADDRIPPHFAAQIERFLPSLDELIDRRAPPRLVHGDLNGDHLLVTPDGDALAPRGIIDFGDAQAGDPLYEIGALHVGMFGGDPALLAAFLRGYGPDEGFRRDFERRALAYTMLHEFDVFADLFERRPALAEQPTLEGLAREVFLARA